MKISSIFIKLLFAILLLKVCYASNFNNSTLSVNSINGTNKAIPAIAITVFNWGMKKVQQTAFEYIWKTVKEILLKKVSSGEQKPEQQQNNIINDKLDTILDRVQELSFQIQELFGPVADCKDEMNAYLNNIQNPIQLMVEVINSYYNDPTDNVQNQIKQECTTGVTSITTLLFNYKNYLNDQTRVYKCKKYDSAYIREWSETIEKTAIYFMFIVAGCERVNEFKSNFDSNKFSDDVNALIRYYKLQGFPNELAQAIKRPGDIGRKEIEDIFKQNLNAEKTVEKLREKYNYFLWQVIFINTKDRSDLLLKKLNSSYSLCDSVEFGNYFNKTAIISWCLTDPVLGFQSIKIVSSSSWTQIRDNNLNQELNYICLAVFRSDTYNKTIEFESFGDISQNSTTNQFSGFGAVRNYAFASSSRKSFNPEIIKSDLPFITFDIPLFGTNYEKTFVFDMIPSYGVKLDKPFKLIENISDETGCGKECEKESECASLSFGSNRCYLYNSDLKINSKFENAILFNFWDFSNRSLNDKVGGAHLYGGGDYSFVDDRFSNPNSAIRIKGYIQIPEGLYFDNDFTISTWIQIKSQLSAEETILDFNKQIVFSATIETIYQNFNNITTLGFKCQVLNSVLRVPGQPIQLNKWYHVVYTRQGNTSYIYVNGDEQKNGIQLSTTNTLQTFNYIGKSNSNNLPSNSPVYDDIKIYRGAMSSKEVMNDYIENRFAIFGKRIGSQDDKTLKSYTQAFGYDKLVLYMDSIIQPILSNKSLEECWTNCLNEPKCMAISIFEPKECRLHSRGYGFLRNEIDGWKSYSRAIL